MGIKKWFKIQMAKRAAAYNKVVLHKVINLPPDAIVELTKDENDLLSKLVKSVQPSQFITRKGRITYTLPSLEDVTLWDMLETRRADTATSSIEAWTGGRYSPDTVLDAIKASKYISEQVENANKLESYLFQTMRGGQDADEDDQIKQAKNLLGIVQLTSELFKCTFAEAKQINYSDAILAISKRNEEIEKEKEQLRKQRAQ